MAAAGAQIRLLWGFGSWHALSMRTKMENSDVSESKRQSQLFSYVQLEERIPKNHSIRIIKDLCDKALERLCSSFDAMYSEVGRSSIPPERLLKSQILIALYSVRSDRMFCERLNWDMLFRWFLDMTFGLREREIRPHIACRRDREVEGLVGRTTRHESYQSSQRKRKLVEQPLGFSPRRIAGG